MAEIDDISKHNCIICGRETESICKQCKEFLHEVVFLCVGHDCHVAHSKILSEARYPKMYKKFGV